MAGEEARQLTEGEVVLAGGTEIPIIVEGYLRSVFTRDGVERAQVKFASEANGPGAYQVVDVARHLVRVAPLVRGSKV